MTSILILPVHSFVDLITNSSSEIFVCETDQKIATFKKTLIKLAELHNEANKLRDGSTEYNYGDLDIPGLFKHHFQNPRIQPFTFRLDLYPKSAEYRLTCGWQHSNVHPIYAEAEQKMKEWRKKHPAPPYSADVKSQQYTAYNTHSAAEHVYRGKVFVEWEKLQAETEESLYRWAFAQNGLDWDAGAPANDRWERWRRSFKNDKAEQFIHDIGQATTYNYGFNKGDIMLETMSSNTVPYTFFDDISRVFRCKQVHLG